MSHIMSNQFRMSNICPLELVKEKNEWFRVCSEILKFRIKKSRSQGSTDHNRSVSYNLGNSVPYSQRSQVLFGSPWSLLNGNFRKFQILGTLWQFLSGRNDFPKNFDTRHLVPTRCWLDMQSNVVWHESRIQPARIEPLFIPFQTAQYFFRIRQRIVRGKNPRPWVIITPAQSGVYIEKIMISDIVSAGEEFAYCTISRETVIVF